MMKTAAANLKQRLATRFFNSRLGALIGDRQGIGSVEFAIIIPLLLMGYLGAFEISVGVGVSRKVAHASSTVADLLTQKKEVSISTLDGMKEVVRAAMAPYSVDNYSLKITGIKVSAAGKGTVVWSRDEAGKAPYKAGTTADIPSELSLVDTFVVRSELLVRHNLMLMSPTLSKSTHEIPISKTYYYQQRLGEQITCKDCPA
ncbi:Flp pilus assembly protein TadG [Pararhizobium capsulatum DSM 1112]|uniref:Flp pilus assembly protein TadG n=1 Tax=Pararhizobium capsulatum DSM 1112 TaxID=1121113 RepID=A0ABU0BJX3_9HYPH|nr:TadE/TadG family type IV pilus assembly protein [Pararhizobium capsulatum]MDQ0318554.1 Flp pilus assembly protein TadG [Pararhizobium capsulatum DSM 1112]